MPGGHAGIPFSGGRKLISSPVREGKTLVHISFFHVGRGFLHVFRTGRGPLEVTASQQPLYKKSEPTFGTSLDS
jgi:hypothetical protein